MPFLDWEAGSGRPPVLFGSQYSEMVQQDDVLGKKLC